MKSPSLSSRAGRWLSPSLRWHLGGSSLSLLLIAAMVHLYRHNDAEDLVLPLPDVRPGEVIELVRQASLWNEARSESERVRRAQTARIETLAAWLPETVNLQELEQQIEDGAEACGCRMLSFDQEGEVSGARVSVVICTVRAEGSFESLTEMIDGLTRPGGSIGCSRVRLHRATDAEGGVAPVAAPDNARATCEAIITLRVSYAGPDTLAARLMKLRGSQ